MKNVIAGIAVLMFAGQVHAGSYNFNCNAVRVSNQGEVQTLKFDSLAGGTINDQRISYVVGDLMGGNIELQLKKKKLAAKVEVKSVIRDFNKDVGGREHSVLAYVADIKIAEGKRVVKYTGTCVEEIMTTCGGNCVEMGE